MDELDARKYIKNLILRNKPKKLEIALEHYKTRFGHSFWGRKIETPKTTEELAKQVGLID